jgi:tRNA U34 5-methylaminomethyl-2-thiouridine-forming methyltransferase MnmC
MKSSFLKGSLGNYRVEITEDGSSTLHSEFFNESCHSQSGAWQESLHNYVYGCELTTRKLTPPHIFEVGFATGLGLVATLSELDPKEGLFFTSCELDHLVALHFCQELEAQKKISNLEKKSLSLNVGDTQNDLEYLRADFCDREGELKIILGDIRGNLPRWRQEFNDFKVHAIYQDAFSPKRNPSLWTYEWFCELREICHEDAILSTYSSTKAVWKGLMAAGFNVKAVEGYARKKLSTRAFLEGETDAQVLDWCKRSPIEMFRDSELP